MSAGSRRNARYLIGTQGLNDQQAERRFLRGRKQRARASLKPNAAGRQQGDGKLTVGLIRGDIYIWSASETGPTMV